MSQINREHWNTLVGDKYPFLRHEFLDLAEKTGCVAPECGWSPRHLTVADDENKGKIRAAMPLYEKTHSWGEFVFDWAWAEAYERNGLNYYPKLVSAVPFTPASSPRILLANERDSDGAKKLLESALILAHENDYSSLHIQFPSNENLPVLEKAGLIIRKDCQFHWYNNYYSSFDDFIKTFTSAKRKKVLRDRRRIRESGIKFRRLHGESISTKTWAIVYKLISRTFILRGSMPYFNEAFFVKVSREIPDGIMVVLAEINSSPIAAAVFFESGTCLYGRYWGSDGNYNSLHFETCYYQGIDYCIETGKKVFEPGTQGEHKISRGFSPTFTYSAHWLAHPQFSSAIEQYLNDEGKHIDRYMDSIKLHAPYKNKKSTL